jgi:hypothetical protein
LALAALCISGQTKAAPLPPKDKSKTSLPAGLDVVPPDGAGFISVRVADLFQSKATQPLREQLAKHQPQYRKEFQKAVGVDIAQIERVVLILPFEFRQEPVVVVTMLKPFDRDAVRQAVVPQSEQKKFKDKSVYVGQRGSRQALYFAGDLVFITTGVKEMENILQDARPKDAKGVLTEAVRLAAGNDALVAAVNLQAPSIRKLGTMLKGEAEALKPLFAPESGRLTAVADKATRVELRLNYADDAAAKKAELALAAGKQFLLAQLAEAKRELARDAERKNIDPFSRWLLQQAGPFLTQIEKDTKSTFTSKRIEAALQVTVNLKASAADLVMFVGGWSFIGISVDSPPRPVPEKNGRVPPP